MSRWTHGSAVVVTVVVAWATLAARQSPPTFQSGTSAVVITAHVTDRNRPVAGLRAGDFEVRDNGVVQAVTLVATDSLPIDMTLVLDTSGSLEGRALARLKADVQEIAEGLRPDDRVRLLTFDADVTDVFGFRPGGLRLPVEAIESGGGTAFYNALAAALIASPETDRPQLVFGFSDGLDTISFLDASQVASLAGRSSATLYLAILRGQPLGPPQMAPYLPRPNLDRLQEAVARTGGMLNVRPPDAALPALFADVIADFRTSYVVSYTPRGVKPGGWHAVVVRTKTGRYSVRARQGYEG